MSETPPGPGWWKASDGNWYPPQSAPGAVQAPPVVPPPMVAPATNKSGKGCLIAVLVVFALIAIFAIGLVVAISFFGNKAADKLENVGDALSTPSTVDADNPDARSEDDVLEVGESVKISGFTATVRSAKFVDEVEGFPPGGSYLVLEVTVENRDNEAQTPFPPSWTVQQPDGLVTPPISIDGGVDGSIGANETVEGSVVFQVSGADGKYFVLYRPDPIDESRGVWPVSP